MTILSSLQNKVAEWCSNNPGFHDTMDIAKELNEEHGDIVDICYKLRNTHLDQKPGTKMFQHKCHKKEGR